MGRTEEQLSPSEALPGIEHPIVFHNGTGFYYICKEYSIELNKRLFECVQRDCLVTARMGVGCGSPIIDNGSHNHPPDHAFREKCLLLHSIQQRLKLQEIPISEILRDALSSIQEDLSENITDSPTHLSETNFPQPICVKMDSPNSEDESETENFEVIEEEIVIEQPIFVKMEHPNILHDSETENNNMTEVAQDKELNAQDSNHNAEPFTSLFLPEENMMERADKKQKPDLHQKVLGNKDNKDFYSPARRRMRQKRKKNRFQKAQHLEKLAKNEDNCPKKLLPHYPRQTYPREAIMVAIKDVENGLSTFRGASKKYNIPESTLRDNYYKRTPSLKTNRVSEMSLPSIQEEMVIVERVRMMMQDGFPISKHQLLSIASNTLRGMCATNSSNSYVPNMRWLDAFLQRHPEIKKRITRDPAIESQLLNWLHDD